MRRKVLVALFENDVSPRFDLTTEVMVVTFGPEGLKEEEETMVLPRASVESLCRMIMLEGIGTVICGAIEEKYLQYLEWKKVSVLHSVLGPGRAALARYEEGRLKPRDILPERGGPGDGI